MNTKKDIVLHQFPFSHFNDKARWTLDFKDIDHERVTYLPGPHAGPIKKLSGQTQTPVLEIHGEIIAGSTGILKRLETMCPDPALFPPKHAEAIDETIQRFDGEVGPATRTVLFSVMLLHGGYLTGMFSTGKGFLTRKLYRATFPLVKGLMAKANGVTEANVEKSFDITRQTLDEVATRVHATGYLVGDSFTAADLTAAALLAPLANPEHPDMRRPTPVPTDLGRLLDEFRDHSSIAWVNTMYREHRPG